jgi:protein O-GlcNAc transferase
VDVRRRIQGAIALQQAGRLAEAEQIYFQVLAEQPECADALHLLGMIATQRRRGSDARELIQRAIEISPHNAFYHGSLGNALQDARDFDGAIAAYQRAIQLKPDLAEAHNNLGNVLRDTGRMDEAIASFREAIRLRPHHTAAHSNLLAMLHYHPRLDGARLLDEHRKWDQQHAQTFQSAGKPHPNRPDPARRLNVGYVSADFCRHPVGRFIAPLLREHNRQNVKVFCYSGVAAPDDFTENLSRSADAWCEALALDDEQLSHRIRSDEIDILVDLSLHTLGNRLLVFARKPAPVQVTWLGYAGTTGLSAIDYRLTDPLIDPHGAPQFYSEKSIHLPATFWCFEPIDPAVEVNELPAMKNGAVTFASLNNFAKVTGEALDLWAAVVAQTPGSRIVIVCPPGKHRISVLERFARTGVEADRLEFVDRRPIAEYLRQFHRIDIALDPFPCGGGTTTCDALWMGVPTITLRGQTAVGRQGVSILTNVDLTDWIADTPQDYLAIAKGAAADLPKLAALRTALRQKMRCTPLMDARRFATDIESAYRGMWQRWCEYNRAETAELPPMR